MVRNSFAKVITKEAKSNYKQDLLVPEKKEAWGLLGGCWGHPGRGEYWKQYSHGLVSSEPHPELLSGFFQEVCGS